MTDYVTDPGGALIADALRLGSWAMLAVLVSSIIAALAIAALVMVRARRRSWLSDGARVITILSPPSVDTDGEALWANLVGLLRPSWRRAWSGQPHVSWEYQFNESGVMIRLWVPGVIPPGLAERAIEAAWPGARTCTGPATAPFPVTKGGRQDVTEAGTLRLARGDALPIVSKHADDPLRLVLNSAAGLCGHQHACVQIVARPVTGLRVTRAQSTARRHSGSSGVGSRVLGGAAEVFTSAALALLDLFTPGHARSRTSTGARTPHSQPGPLAVLEQSGKHRAIAVKLAGPQYETLVRYAVTTSVAEDDPVAGARELARGRAHALASAYAAYTGHNFYRRTRLRKPLSVFAGRWLTRGDLLSVPELAALAHLPTDAAIPGLARAGARALAPPPAVPIPGPSAKPLGNSDTGAGRAIGLPVRDARHHMHILGATGSGKSNLIGNLVLDDVAQGRGCVVIDIKGDLVTDLLARLPEDAAPRVTLFDADYPHSTPRLNPLEGEQDALVVDNLVSVFARIYSGYWGPRTDDLLRNVCLTLRTQATPSLADIPGLLTEPAAHRRIVNAVKDPIVKGFWRDFESLSPGSRAQVAGPLLNKLRALLLRPFVREAITGKSSFSMNDVLDQGGILLARIPKGSLGDETAKVVGSLLVAAVWQATTARASQPQSERADAAVYLDECHNLLNLPYAIDDMLAEARGLRVALVLAHQHLAQLPRDMRDGISANARNKISFSCSPEDARDLERHTAPHLTAHDLSHLDAFRVAARIVVAGEEQRPFTLATSELPPPAHGRARRIRAIASHSIAGSSQRPSAETVSPAEPSTETSKPAVGKPVVDPRRPAAFTHHRKAMPHIEGP